MYVNTLILSCLEYEMMILLYFDLPFAVPNSLNFRP